MAAGREHDFQLANFGYQVRFPGLGISESEGWFEAQCSQHCGHPRVVGSGFKVFEDSEIWV